MAKRWKTMSMFIAVVITLLAGRLAYIQILGKEDLSAAAYVQQQVILEGADARGTIYDRYGNPIAGQQEEYIYIIEEKNFDGETMNALNEVYAEEVHGQKDAYKVFTSDIYNKKTGERLIRNSNAYILEAGRRYSADQSAVHLIGYVNPADSSGASGLELQYDEELTSLNKQVSATADVKGNLMQGKGLTVVTAADNDSYIKDGIATTLDLELQKKVENILSAEEKDGAVVITRSDTGEILASASTPGFSPEKVESYMNSNGGELINKVTQGGYPPGSVFKIVVAAAALEAGLSSDASFFCSGSEIIEGNPVTCSTGGEDGHGDVTFAEAFADSCNCAFIQIAKKTGAEEIINMAEQMGLGNTVMDSYPDEIPGNMMTIEESGGAAIANLALGQGETLVTPIQIAAMTGIVANGGLKQNPYVVMNRVDVSEPERVISEETAAELQKMMELTMSSGTGKNLEADVTMAAKTGSAESVQTGIEMIHGWITGYVPAENPEYVITVFIEDGRSGSGSAGPLFAEITDYLNESKRIQFEVGF